MSSRTQVLLALLSVVTPSCSGPETTSPADATSADGVADADAEVEADGELPMPESCLTDFMCTFGLVCERDACVELPCATRDHCLVGSRACIVVESKSVCALVECGCIDCEACDIGQICNNGTCGVP